jgi:hypothetical protein
MAWQPGAGPRNGPTVSKDERTPVPTGEEDISGADENNQETITLTELKLLKEELGSMGSGKISPNMLALFMDRMKTELNKVESQLADAHGRRISQVELLDSLLDESSREEYIEATKRRTCESDETNEVMTAVITGLTEDVEERVGLLQAARNLAAEYHKMLMGLAPESRRRR